MDTAGKAVLFSGVTVLIALSAVMLVPSPAFRSMALGIMLSVVFVLAATLTLLPAVLAQARRARRPVRAAVGPPGRAPLGLASPAGASGSGERPSLYGLPALSCCWRSRPRSLGLRTGMPSITVVPPDDPSRVGYEQVQDAFGAGRPGDAPGRRPAGGDGRGDRGRRCRRPGHRPASRRLAPAARGSPSSRPTPAMDPSDPDPGATIDRLRDALPAGASWSAARPPRTTTSRPRWRRYTPIVIGVVLALGFLLLLFAFQAPLAAAIGVCTSLLSTGAAFGVARLIFQDGHLRGCSASSRQGFLDAWGPVFFFAMIFAISMDYTVFLLSSAKEHWDRSGDAREAVVGGLAHSGRVILAAAAVMVAVFFTFALSGPLPPKEMGIILGVAVLLDALLVRLLLIPVLLRLAGAAAWARPRWLRRLLPDVRFGH